MNCPKCKSSDDVVRVQRPAIVKALFPMFKRYHCEHCCKSYYQVPVALKHRTA